MVRPRMDWLELDITYVCGMNCHNCNRMTGIAPGRPEQNITVAQIETLIADSIRLQYPWKEWFLVGGEPTTHPDLDAIVSRIAEYRAAHNPELRFDARNAWPRREYSEKTGGTLCDVSVSAIPELPQDRSCAARLRRPMHRPH